LTFGYYVILTKQNITIVNVYKGIMLICIRELESGWHTCTEALILGCPWKRNAALSGWNGV